MTNRFISYSSKALLALFHKMIKNLMICYFALNQISTINSNKGGQSLFFSFQNGQKPHDSPFSLNELSTSIVTKAAARLTFLEKQTKFRDLRFALYQISKKASDKDGCEPTLSFGGGGDGQNSHEFPFALNQISKKDGNKCGCLPALVSTSGI